MAFRVFRLSRLLAGELLAATVAVPLLLAAPASAQPVDDATRAAARKLGSSGLEAFQAHDYATANDKLGRAFRILQAPSLGLWSARALEKLGKLVEAQERYLKVTRLPIVGGDAEVQKKAQAEAAADLASLSPRVPTIVVQVEGASPSDVTLTIDGGVLSSDLVGEAFPVDPGSHQVVGVRGAERIEADVLVAESEHKSTALRFGSALAGAAAPGASPPSQAAVAQEPAAGASSSGISQRTVGWVTLGVGAAGLAVGTVTGIIALADRGGLSQGGNNCYGSKCGTAMEDKVDSYNSMRTFSTVGFIAGGVLATTGVVLLLTAPRATSSASLVIQPSSVFVRGVF